MGIQEDIEIAKQIIQQKEKERALHDDSSSIYKSTNENMNDANYIELLKNKKSILSVIGSGDQILNSILMDSYDIDAFDINRFAKYYLELKMSAVMSLSYEEFLAFFYDNRTFNRKLYAKVLGNLKGDAKEFWERVAYYKRLAFGKDQYSPKEVYNSGLFIPGIIKRENAIENNPYLSKENYYLLREKIKNAKIRYFRGNIFGLQEVLEKPYDFVNLSNINMYSGEFILSSYKRREESPYKKFIRNLKLNPDGRVLNYLMGYTKGSISERYTERELITDDHYEIFVVKNKDHMDDALAVYKK